MITVEDFLSAIPDPQRQADCRTIAAIMHRVTGSAPKMWGQTVVGYGHYHYVYESGREGDWFLCGFSPRAKEVSIYLMSGFTQHGDLLAALGKHKAGKGCLYIRRLGDVDLAVFEQLVAESVRHLRETYPDA